MNDDTTITRRAVIIAAAAAAVPALPLVAVAAGEELRPRRAERDDDFLPADTLKVMEETRARVAAMTPAERNAPLKRRPPGRENVDPNLG